MSSSEIVNERGMPYTATRLSLTDTEDSGGDSTETFAPNGTFPCRITPMGSGRAAHLTAGAGDRINEEATHMVTCPVETTIESNDRLSINGDEYAILTITTFGTEETAKRMEVRQI